MSVNDRCIMPYNFCSTHAIRSGTLLFLSTVIHLVLHSLSIDQLIYINAPKKSFLFCPCLIQDFSVSDQWFSGFSFFDIWQTCASLLVVNIEIKKSH